MINKDREREGGRQIKRGREINTQIEKRHRRERVKRQKRVREGKQESRERESKERKGEKKESESGRQLDKIYCLNMQFQN